MFSDFEIELHPRTSRSSRAYGSRLNVCEGLLTYMLSLSRGSSRATSPESRLDKPSVTSPSLEKGNSNAQQFVDANSNSSTTESDGTVSHGVFYNKLESEQGQTVIHNRYKQSRKVRKNRSKKLIGHPPDIVSKFIDVEVEIPKTDKDIEISILSLEQRINYYKKLNKQELFSEMIDDPNCSSTTSTSNNVNIVNQKSTNPGRKAKPSVLDIADIKATNLTCLDSDNNDVSHLTTNALFRENLFQNDSVHFDDEQRASLNIPKLYSDVAKSCKGLNPANSNGNKIVATTDAHFELALRPSSDVAADCVSDVESGVCIDDDVFDSSTSCLASPAPVQRGASLAPLSSVDGCLPSGNRRDCEDPTTSTDSNISASSSGCSCSMVDTNAPTPRANDMEVITLSDTQAFTAAPTEIKGPIVIPTISLPDEEPTKSSGELSGLSNSPINLPNVILCSSDTNEHRDCSSSSTVKSYSETLKGVTRLSVCDDPRPRRSSNPSQISGSLLSVSNDARPRRSSAQTSNSDLTQSQEQFCRTSSINVSVAPVNKCLPPVTGNKSGMASLGDPCAPAISYADMLKKKNASRGH